MHFKSLVHYKLKSICQKSVQYQKKKTNRNLRKFFFKMPLPASLEVIVPGLGVFTASLFLKAAKRESFAPKFLKIKKSEFVVTKCIYSTVKKFGNTLKKAKFLYARVARLFDAC